jgi:2-oxoglutarate ferredoxin oxidoreductase subunit beta
VRRLRARLSISAAIIQACWELDIEPHRVAKLSGIGCSSKTPDYFLGASHGFNTVHGRMPSVLTGANLANRDLLYLGVSGDGDSAQHRHGPVRACHAARRAHGLHRREQRRLRPDQGPVQRHRRPRQQEQEGRGQPRHPVDLIGLALQLGATYVARGFSGDKAQLVPLIKGAIRHGGAAFIDVISPCVAFNNHAGSTRSYDHVREHNEAVSRIDFIDLARRGDAEPAPGEVIELPQPDGSVMRLRKLHEGHDPTDRRAAMNLVQRWQAEGEIATGLLYVEPAGDRPARRAGHRADQRSR